MRGEMRGKKMRIVLVAYMIVASIAAARAEGDSVRTTLPEKVIGLAETVLKALTVESGRVKMAVYPAGAYGERTGLEIGVMPTVQIGSEKFRQPLTITPSVLVSTKKMFEVQADMELYTRGGTDVIMKAEMYRLPDDYYETGNGRGKKSVAEYRFERRMVTAEALRHIGDRGLIGGVFVDVDRYNFRDIEVKDTTAETWRLWEDAGTSFGGGVVVGRDSRDNTLQPRRGTYTRVRLTGYRRDDGRKFQKVEVDARRYFGIGEKATLAIQMYAARSWGQCPFPKMPTHGGTRLGRAIGHSMKYVDAGAWIAQAEVRRPLFWRIGGVLWTGVGTVFGETSQVMEGMHVMGGGGIRVSVFKDGGLNLRLDGGVSQRGDGAIYLNIREAF